MIFYTRKPRKKNPKTGVALFIADLIDLLDHAGLPVYGKSGRHNSHSRSGLTCLDHLGRLNTIRVIGYGPEQYGLTRIAFNCEGFYTRVTADLLPAKSKQEHDFIKGPRMEITLLQVDLPDMLSPVIGLLTGEVLNTGNFYGYHFDPRAVPVNNQRQADYAFREAASKKCWERIAAQRAATAAATPPPAPVCGQGIACRTTREEQLR